MWISLSTCRQWLRYLLVLTASPSRTCSRAEVDSCGAIRILATCIAETKYLTHYCVVRADIPFGAQAAQLIHAAGQSVNKPLAEGSYAIALHVKDEGELRALAERLKDASIGCALIIESDAPYANQALAIGIAPMDRAKLKPLLSSYPLARYKAPLAQSDRASGVMTRKVGGLNPSGCTTSLGPLQRMRRWFTGRN